MAVGVAIVLLAVSEPDEADEETIALAQAAFERAQAEGVDMANGPCLGLIEPGWVADVAHEPRQPVDDEPENQCEEYRSGDVDRFVELDPQGRYIKSGGRRFFGWF